MIKNKKNINCGRKWIIGFHLAKKCVQKSWIVTSVSRKPPKKRLLEKVNYILCDISSKKKCLKNK